MEYTNLQQEIIKIFKYDLPEEQLIDIKKIVQNYLLENIDQSIDNLISKNDFSQKDYDEWLNEDFRSKK